jgi:hypothetical protein
LGFEGDDEYPTNSNCGMIHRLFIEVNIENGSSPEHATLLTAQSDREINSIYQSYKNITFLL